jgi:aminoglycoside/choline kinase family phosphotransferase
MTTFPHSKRLQAAAAGKGVSLHQAQPLAGDGSDRRFYRLPGPRPLVLLYHPHPPGGAVNENDSYFFIGQHLLPRGVPVPEIYAYCREEGWMLLEDLGDASLESTLGKSPPAKEVRRWYSEALRILVNMQEAGRAGFDPAWCFDTPVLNRPFLRERECRYFVEAFLQGYLGLKFTLEDLASDFERILAAALPPDCPEYFLHRDFQSRNLFVKEERLRVIDFQGARLGPLGYDVAALLIDPYVDLSPAWQEELLEHYLELLEDHVAMDPPAFREQYYHLALCRNLQILGAFGFLTRVKGKDYFAHFIPPALAGLRRRLQERPGAFPRLEQVVLGLR